MASTIKLQVLVFTVAGACKDILLLEKLHIGTYEIENLHLIDEATTRCLDFSVSRLCTTLLILEKTVAQWWGRWGSTYISLSPYYLITLLCSQDRLQLVLLYRPHPLVWHPFLHTTWLLSMRSSCPANLIVIDIFHSLYLLHVQDHHTTYILLLLFNAILLNIEHIQPCMSSQYMNS